MAGTAEWFLRIEVGRVGGNVLLSSCRVLMNTHDQHVVCIMRRIWCAVHTHFVPICTPVVTVKYTLTVLQRSRVTFR